MTAAGEIIERAAAIGDVGVEALGRRLLVQALFEAGDLRSRRSRYSLRTCLCPPGSLRVPWYPPLGALRWRFARGRDAGAPGSARAQLEAIVGEVRGTNAALLAGLQQGMMALDLADPNLASQSLQPVRVMEAVDDVRVQVIAALVRAFAGDLDEARESLDRCVEVALAAELDSAWPALMMNLAELIVAVGGHPAAKAVRHAIEPYGSVWVVAGIGAAIRGPLDGALGSLAALDGDWDATDSHFAAAHDAALRAGAVLVAAIVDHRAGRALGDRARLNRAAAVWRRVGATGRLRRSMR